MIIIISAIGSNRVIGNGDGLPWHIPAEYNKFLDYIKGEHQDNVYFPEFEEGEWMVEKKEEHAEFTFVIYKRKT